MEKALTYLVEARARLIKSLLLISLLFIPLFFYANSLFNCLAKPLLKHLQGSMIATDITAPLLVPIELALKTAITLAAPYLFYQTWAFIAPALYPRERNMTKQLLCASVVLFYLGVAFCYWVVLPMLFGFLTHATPADINLMPDISYYLSLSSRFFLLFGLSFQVPVVTVFLVRVELVRLESLISARPYVIVSAFTIGMLLTPPDVLSQVLLALPVCLLFEAGVMTCKVRAVGNSKLRA